MSDDCETGRAYARRSALTAHVEPLPRGNPLSEAMAQLKEWSCPTHGSFVLELDGTRKCGLIGCPWTLPPLAPPPASGPSAEAMLAATQYWYPNGVPKWIRAENNKSLVKCAAALDAFATQAVQQERERCLEILNDEGWLGRTEQRIANGEAR
jgi:hypothetical protein